VVAVVAGMVIMLEAMVGQVVVLPGTAEQLVQEL
jgi:hypothetical protein